MRRLLTVVSILSIVFLFLFGGVSRSLAASDTAGQCAGYLDAGNTKVDTSDGSIVLDAGLTVCIHASNGNTGSFTTDGTSTLADYIVASGLLNNGGQVPNVSNYVVYGTEVVPSATPSPSPSAEPSVDPSPSVTPSPQPSDAPSATPSATPSTSSSPSATTVPPPTTGTTKTPPPTDTVGTTTKTDGLNLSLILAAVLAVSTLISLLQPRRLRRHVVRKNRS